MDLISVLKTKRILLFDGSMGTQLMEKGLKQGELPDKWNIDRPDVMRDFFKTYYDSGSDLVQTATFRSNKIALNAAGHGDLLKDINESSAKLLRSVCPEGKFVIGDIGPNGTFLPPVGNATVEDFIGSFEEQVRILDPFIDAFHVETISDLEEMKAALTAITRISNKPIIASMTYKKTKRGFFTIMGNSVDQCFDELLTSGASVIGANCTLGSSDFVELFKTYREYNSDFPLSIKPNAGQPELQIGKMIYKQTAKAFVSDIKQIIDLEMPPLIVGGCCGTGPEHIKLLRELIDQYTER
ncbi:MAG: homocysteine S-methyltransferase family protein [Candidatus Hodarchaeales archaeon]